MLYIIYIYIHIFTQLENHRYILSSTIILSHFFFYPELDNVSSHSQSVFVYLCHVIDESLTEIQQSTPSELLLHTTTQNYQLSGDKQIAWNSYSVPWILNNAIFHIARLHALPIWAIAGSCVINEPHLAVKKVWMLEYTGKNADSQWHAIPGGLKRASCAVHLKQLCDCNFVHHLSCSNKIVRRI